MTSPTDEPARKDGQTKQIGTDSTDWEHLVSLVANGDPAGIEALHRAFHRGLLFWFRGFPDDAEDLAHEVLLDVVDAIRRQMLLYPDRLCGFVRTVAHRKAATQINRRVQSRAREVTSEVSEAAVDYRDTPEQQAMAREHEAIAKAVLEALQPKDREVLIRFYVDEQSPTQICRDMGLSPTQFRLLKSRAKQRFAEMGHKRVVGKAPRHVNANRLFHVTHAGAY